MTADDLDVTALESIFGSQLVPSSPPIGVWSRSRFSGKGWGRTRKMTPYDDLDATFDLFRVQVVCSG